MASIAPPTPVYLDGPEPHVVAAIRELVAADRHLAEVIVTHSSLGEEHANAMEAQWEAYHRLNAIFPLGIGWYQVDGRWWGRAKRSKFGLELMSLDELPRALRMGL